MAGDTLRRRRRAVAGDHVERGQPFDRSNPEVSVAEIARRRLVEGRATVVAGHELAESRWTHGCKVPVGYVPRHVPRCAPRPTRRQARRHHGRLRLHPDLRRARRGGQSLEPALRVGGPAPGDHIAICMENHDRYLEVVWGCHYAGLVYTCASSRLQSSELEYIVNDCEARAFITSKYKADQAPRSRRDARRRAAADARRDDRRLRELRGRRRRAAARAARRGADRRHRHAVLVGHDRAAEGRHPALRAEPLDDRPGRRRPAAAAVRLGRHQAVPLPRALLPRRPAALLPRRPTRSGRRSSRWSTSTPRPTCGSSTSTRSPTARSCRRCSSACSSCPTRSAHVRRLVARVRDPRRRAVPVPVKQQMIEWFGPVIHEYYAGTEGNGFVYCNSEMWLAHEGTVGTPINVLAAHRATTREGRCRRVDSGTVYFEGGAEFEYHNDPEKTKGSRHPKGWSHARRRRLPRRRQLPVPHRPQGVHDHHRRRERLPAGGRERCWSRTRR